MRYGFGMPSLQRLIYVSEARSGLTPRGVQDIVNASHINNQMSGLTGLLIHDSGYFLQVLEGTRDDVESTFKRISQDGRHANCQILLVQPITHRAFPKWLMKFRDRLSLPHEEGLTLLDLEAIANASDRKDLADNRALQAFLSALLNRFQGRCAA